MWFNTGRDRRHCALSIKHCCFNARWYISIRHADKAKVSRSSSVIAFRLVAQYSDVPTASANPKYFDFSKAFEPTDCPFTAVQPGFLNRLQLFASESNLAVGLQASQKMPRKRTAQFQVLDLTIPAIEADKARVKAAFISGKPHLGEVTVLGFSVTIFVKEAIINRHASHAVRPQQSYQIDAFDDRFLFSRPMAVEQGIARRIRLLQSRIIQNQNTGVQVNLRSCFFPKLLGIRFEARQQSRESVMRRSVWTVGLNALGLRSP